MKLLRDCEIENKNWVEIVWFLGGGGGLYRKKYLKIKTFWSLMVGCWPGLIEDVHHPQNVIKFWKKIYFFWNGSLQ